MMKIIFYITMAFFLLEVVSGTYAQETTRVSATLKLHPWLNLPVVESIDIKGGLKNFGSMNLGDSPAAALNLAIHELKREIGMIASVTESVSNKKRYFEYIGTDNWLEVFVINSWEPGHTYALGDYIAYQGNFYVANAAFTSDANAFATDAGKWNNAGGKDGKYSATELKMDNQVLSKVAASGTTVQDADKDKTIATVGFVNSSGGSFDANKTITRAGLNGITGSNFQTTNIVDFLNKLFFPVLGPKIKSFKYNNNSEASKFSSQIENPATKVITDNVGHINIEFGDWNGQDLAFNYDLEQRDATIPITKVELLKNGVSIADPVTNGSTAGTLTLKKSISVNFTNVDITQDIPVTLKVTDNSSNEVSLDLNVSFIKANGVTLDNVRISPNTSGDELVPVTGNGGGTPEDPYLIGRTGANLNYYLFWTVIGNADAGKVTQINFSGTPTLSNLSSQTNVTLTNVGVTFPYNADASIVYRVGASAWGSVAKDDSPVVFSKSYKLQDTIYCGFLSASDIPGNADGFAAMDYHKLKNLQYKNLNHSQCYNNGVDLTNSSGNNGFFTWAVPTYRDGNLSAPEDFTKKPYYENNQVWSLNDRTTTGYVKVKIGGGNVYTWYWVCIFTANTANTNSMKAKLLN